MDVSHVVRLARAEGERMRAAITDAETAAKVNMDVRQFAKLAELIVLLCDLVPEPGGTGSPRPLPDDRLEETLMEKSRSMQGQATLAQLETDMIAAEAAYADADERLRQAQRDRDAALAAINRHQAAFDQAIARLRDRSPPESAWKGSGEREKGVLMLEHEEGTGAEGDLIRQDQEGDQSSVEEAGTSDLIAGAGER